MTRTLGISCFYHDAAAALVCDGDIVAAAQEERFSRIKGDSSFPVSAINFCLEQARCDVADLDAVVFYDKPRLTGDRLLTTYLATAPRGLESWLAAMPEWISKKAHVGEIVRSVLGYKGQVLTVPHHLSHAASAFYPSPFDKAAILTLDGVGEWATASVGVGEGDRVTLLREMRFPDSLGLLYSAMTYFCGFKVNSGEYKLMGLAPYGRPTYVDTLKERVVEVLDDGTVKLDMEYFGFLSGLEMVSDRFAELFGGPRRKPESRITRREMDLAASLQAVTEESILAMAKWTRRETGCDNLCLAGGVALNCVANGKLLRSGVFDSLWIQPAAGDAGGALGAACVAQHGYFDVPRLPLKGRDRQKGSLLGPGFSSDEIGAYLDANGIPYRALKDAEWSDTIADALVDGAVVGFFNGRMEFGPRALGARSILGDSRRSDTQRTMNLKIKFRESFRPFAPSVLAERSADYFELDTESPYMLLVAPVREDCRLPMPPDESDSDDLIEKVNIKRSDIPSVTHVDYSARVQSVHRDTNPAYYDAILAFEKRTGCGVIVNTSFNVRGEPIVCTPEDAYRCFMRTNMDYLFLGGMWLEKTDQPAWDEDGDWREEFELD